MSSTPIQLGHVNIFVQNVDRAEKFYTEALGLTIMNRRPNISFLAANTAHSHEIALIGLGDDAPRPERGRVGLNHMAWQMATFEDLKSVHQRLKDMGADIIRVTDHYLSMGVYFRDTEGNENEVYYELPKDQWPEAVDGDLFTGKFPWQIEDDNVVSSPQRSVTVQ